MATTHFKGPIVITGTGASSNAGSSSIAGTLAVTGAVTASSTLAVTGAITATGGVVGSISGGNTTNTINGITAAIVSAVPNGVLDVASAANIETITGTSGALSVTKLYSAIDSTAGAGSRTLAAPGASGRIKIIVMTVDNGDTTLSLANVAGGSAATTATFDDVGDCLILLSAGSKWIVLGNTATLS